MLRSKESQNQSNACVRDETGRDLSRERITADDEVLLYLTNIRTSQQAEMSTIQKEEYAQLLKWRRAEMKGKPFKTRAVPSTFCRSYRLAILKIDKGLLKHVTFTKLPCNSWTCPACQINKALKVKRLLKETIILNDLSFFLTLTLDPKKIPEEYRNHNNNLTHKYITKLFNHFCTTLRRKTFNYFDDKKGKFISFKLDKEADDLKYIWVIEFQKNGNAHLHILLNQFLPIQAVREVWTHIGGGHIMRVENVKNIYGISVYLSDYIVKGIKSDSTKESGFKYYEKRYQISKYCLKPTKNVRAFFNDFELGNLTEQEVKDGLKLYSLDWLGDYLYNPNYKEQSMLLNTALTHPKNENRAVKIR